jgi:surfactin synthase thioesterase subunit
VSGREEPSVSEAPQLARGSRQMSIGIVRPAPRPEARLRLVCFPYAGGGSAAFATWPESLGPEIEVCAVQLPGRETRIMQQAFQDTATMVPVLADVLAARVAPPYAFFGHSMGAVVAFELARWLRANGQPAPVHMFASARRAPQLPLMHSLLHVLPDDEFLEELHGFGGTPPQLLADEGLLRLLLPMLRADFAVNDTYEYQPEPPLDCPITATGGLTDPHVPQASLAAWQDQTTGPFALAMFRGGHFYLRAARSELLGLIASALEDRIPSNQ